MAYNTIKLKKYLDVIEEFEAESTIIPGMLVELASTGHVQAHSTAGGNSLPMFALEDEMQGKDIDDSYVDGDQVQVWVAVRGEEVYAILADGEDIDIGDFLESAGQGFLRKHVAEVVDESWDAGESQEANTIDLTVHPSQIVGIALEAKDLSDSSGAESSSAVVGYARRIKVKIM